MTEKIKLQYREGGNIYRVPVTTWVEKNRRFFQYGFNKALTEEIKMMKNRKYHGFEEPPRKLWSIEINQRNDFQLRYLKGEKPYARYDSPLKVEEYPPRFNKAKGKELPLFRHQPEMIAHILQRRQCIVGGETGVSKTLAAIISLEKVGQEFYTEHGSVPRFWYVAPKSALRGVEREFIIWGSKVTPEFMTYDKMKSRMENWKPGDSAPYGVIFDESQKLKNRTSQRSMAAQRLADSIREEWGDRGLVVLMSGTPAPKSPVDWYSQCEIACPGFLREGDEHMFKNELGIIVKKTSGIDGGVYPQLVCWKDDEKKCNVCGQLASHESHNTSNRDDDVNFGDSESHAFVPSKNEILRLYKRLKGLVEIWWKKDCLDLPDKFYKVIEVKPTKSILRAASMIAKTAKTTIDGLTRLRELSDGFQYEETPDGMKTCPRCTGNKEATEYEEIPGTCPTCKDGIPEGLVVESEYARPVCPNHLPQRKPVTVSCPECGGKGEVVNYKRTTKEVGCPKDQVLVDLLEEYDDVGRIVIFAGFTGSIDRVCKICRTQDWHVIRLDQGKEQILDPEGNRIEEKDYVSMFLDWKEKYPRVAFVAHPASGGTGLTLTSSPVILYFSNDFVGENRMQSEDRIHRPGMDLSRGATIIDLIHLPSDAKVLANLQKKRDLQSMSLGELAQSLSLDSSDERQV